VNLAHTYLDLCHTGDPAAMLENMGDARLAGLARHLEAAGVSGGVPGIMLGLVELEIVKRWVAQNLGNHSPVGEG
jgi:hypothetical protein